MIIMFLKGNNLSDIHTFIDLNGYILGWHIVINVGHNEPL